MMDPIITAELAKCDDNIPFRAARNHSHHTWARTFYSSPELYIQPESAAEISKIVTLAQRCRRRITTVGCGHSPSKITSTSSWMVNLDRFNKVLSVDKNTNHVVVQAGIRLWQLGDELDRVGLAMPNLGSIDHQSIAGAISTGTHGSTLRHGVLSESVKALRITLSNGKSVLCTPTQDNALFRAALVSLGALGIITEITFAAVPRYSVAWKQTIEAETHIFDTWSTTLWTQAEFVRVWWFPYTRRATVWQAEKTDLPERAPAYSFYDAKLGYHVYHNLLYLAQSFPRILPWVEWFIFGLQYGFRNGTSQSAIQPSRDGLLMNCLYSQFVNEWAIPLRNGPEALQRLGGWINGRPESEHRIPFSSAGLYVHAPLEVRVSDTRPSRPYNTDLVTPDSRPYLDTSSTTEATLFLNATLYRPFDQDPPCRARYYEAFEWLMRDLGGRPHWAKNFEASKEQLESMYGEDLVEWRKARNSADPEGMFVGEWHRQTVLDGPRLALEECETGQAPLRAGGIEISSTILGALPRQPSETPPGKDVRDALQVEGAETDDEVADERARRSRASSEESFEMLDGAEAEESVLLAPRHPGPDADMTAGTRAGAPVGPEPEHKLLEMLGIVH